MTRLHALQGRHATPCPECSHPLSSHNGTECRECQEEAGVEFWAYCGYDQAQSAWHSARLLQLAKSRRLCCAPPADVDP